MGNEDQLVIYSPRTYLSVVSTVPEIEKRFTHGLPGNVQGLERLRFPFSFSPSPFILSTVSFSLFCSVTVEGLSSFSLLPWRVSRPRVTVQLIVMRVVRTSTKDAKPCPS